MQQDLFKGWVFLMLALPVQETYAGPFFEDHTRGWHWYEALPRQALPDPQREEKEESQEGSREETPSAVRPKTPSELVKAYRQELEARLHKAWVDPTPQNVQSYQKMQKDLMDRSKTFSTVWMQNVFQNPGLDHTLVSPVNQQARHIQIDLEKDRTKKAIQSLSQTFGLFFFFSGECPYCHQFAPIVKRFSEAYGWEVIAISVDGGVLAEFPQAQGDNGLFQAWDIKALPSLYAVNPKTREAIPIAYGLTSLDEMENRILMLLDKKP